MRALLIVSALLIVTPLHAKHTLSVSKQSTGLSVSAPAPRAFFGTTTDRDTGTEAWLIAVDIGKKTGAALVPPVMAKLATLKLGPGEAIEFETESVFEKHCRFRGVLTTNRLDGKVAIIEDEGAHQTLAEYPLTADEILTGSNGNAEPGISAHYSNKQSSTEGGDLLGLDLEFFITARGPVGVMVPYQSYWDLPTLAALPLSEIRRDGPVIRFALKLDGETMNFQLQPVAGGVRLLKDGDQYRPEGVILKGGKFFLK